MSIIISKQQKRHGLVDPIFILFLSALIVLAIFAVSTGNIDHLVDDILGSLGSAPASLSVHNEPSFDSDQRYWAANCSHGGSSDLVCDAIESRTQSCSISAESAYCSEYATYLQQLNK